MSKTVLSAGTVVNSAYLNAINGVDGSTGIVHDGANTNGHAPKIDPVAHIVGVTEGNISRIFGSNYFDASVNSSARNVNIHWSRREAINTGDPAIIKLYFSGISQLTGGSLTYGLEFGGVDSSLVLPLNLRPTATVRGFAPCINGAKSFGLGTITINTDGSVSFFGTTCDDSASPAPVYGYFSGFCGSGNKGFCPFEFEYPIW
jgi:hypothetical protein